MAAISKSIASRIGAALIGGYLFTTVFSLLVFFVFADFQVIDPQTQEVKPQAILSVINSAGWSELVSFLIYTGAALWIFHTKTAKRAWVGMLLSSIVGMGLIYLMLPPGLIPGIKQVLEILL